MNLWLLHDRFITLKPPITETRYEYHLTKWFSSLGVWWPTSALQCEHFSMRKLAVTFHVFVLLLEDWTPMLSTCAEFSSAYVDLLRFLGSSLKDVQVSSPDSRFCHVLVPNILMLLLFFLSKGFAYLCSYLGPFPCNISLWWKFANNRFLSSPAVSS